MASFVFYGGVHSILIGELSLFTFKVAIDGYIRTVILLIVLGCFRSSFCSFYLLLLSSLAMWWLSLVLCLDSFLCVCLLIGFWFVVTIRFIYNRPCLLWGLLLPGWAELGPGAAACGTGFRDWRWPVDGQLSLWCWQSRVRTPKQRLTSQCQQAPQMAPSGAFVPKGIPSSLLPLWEANISKRFWPRLLKN